MKINLFCKFFGKMCEEVLISMYDHLNNIKYVKTRDLINWKSVSKKLNEKIKITYLDKETENIHLDTFNNDFIDPDDNQSDSDLEEGDIIVNIYKHYIKLNEILNKFPYLEELTTGMWDDEISILKLKKFKLIYLKNCTNYLDKLKKIKTLKYLEIEGSPDFSGSMYFQNAIKSLDLSELILIDCSIIDKEFGKFQNLNKLHLKRCPNLTNKSLINLINLKDLKINNCEKINGKSIKNMQNIQKISLTNVKFIKMGLDYVNPKYLKINNCDFSEIESLKYMKNLKTLKLYNIKIKNLNILYQLDLIKLSLKVCKGKRCKSPNCEFENCKNNGCKKSNLDLSKLEKLKKFTIIGYNCLNKIYVNNKYLEKLKVINKMINKDFECNNLKKIIYQNDDDTWLNLHQVKNLEKIEYFSCKSINNFPEDMLNKMPNLKYLYIPYSYRLIDNLLLNLNLITLSINRSPIKNTSLLKNQKHIKNLTISNTFVSDEDIQHLDLVKLNCANCPNITNKTVENMKNLEDLTIGGSCQISADGIKHLNLKYLDVFDMPRFDTNIKYNIRGLILNTYKNFYY